MNTIDCIIIKNNKVDEIKTHTAWFHYNFTSKEVLKQVLKGVFQN